MKNIEEVNMTETNRRIIQRIRTAVQEILPDSSLILFGSRARGNPDGDSDWDILILTEKVTDEIENTLSDILYDIELEENIIINPLVLPKEEWEFKRYKNHPIHRHVEAEGVLL